METTPIEVLEHHVEMLENELRRSDPNNYLFRSVIKIRNIHISKGNNRAKEHRIKIK